MRGRIAVAACVAVVVFLLIATMTVGPRWIHDLQMVRYRWSATSIPLAEGRVVGSVTQFGNLAGSSNFCEGRVWVAIDSGEAPAVFLAAMTPSPRLAAPFDVQGVLLWEVDEGVMLPLEGGQLVAEHERSLTQSEPETLGALAPSHVVEPGRHLYVLQASSTSHRERDLADWRCR